MPVGFAFVLITIRYLFQVHAWASGFHAFDDERRTGGRQTLYAWGCVHDSIGRQNRTNRKVGSLLIVTVAFDIDSSQHLQFAIMIQYIIVRSIVRQFISLSDFDAGPPGQWNVPLEWESKSAFNFRGESGRENAGGDRKGLVGNLDTRWMTGREDQSVTCGAVFGGRPIGIFGSRSGGGTEEIRGEKAVMSNGDLVFEAEKTRFIEFCHRVRSTLATITSHHKDVPKLSGFSGKSLDLNFQCPIAVDEENVVLDCARCRASFEAFQLCLRDFANNRDCHSEIALAMDAKSVRKPSRGGNSKLDQSRGENSATVDCNRGRLQGLWEGKIANFAAGRHLVSHIESLPFIKLKGLSAVQYNERCARVVSFDRSTSRFGLVSLDFAKRIFVTSDHLFNAALSSEDIGSLSLKRRVFLAWGAFLKMDSISREEPVVGLDRCDVCQGLLGEDWGRGDFSDAKDRWLFLCRECECAFIDAEDTENSGEEEKEGDEGRTSGCTQAEARQLVFGRIGMLTEVVEAAGVFVDARGIRAKEQIKEKMMEISAWLDGFTESAPETDEYLTKVSEIDHFMETLMSKWKTSVL